MVSLHSIQSATLSSEKKTLLPRPLSEELRSSGPQSRPVTSKMDRVEITISGRRQKDAAVTRLPYKGLQVPKVVSSRADTSKRDQYNKKLQRVR